METIRFLISFSSFQLPMYARGAVRCAEQHCNARNVLYNRIYPKCVCVHLCDSGYVSVCVGATFTIFH